MTLWKLVLLLSSGLYWRQRH